MIVHPAPGGEDSGDRFLEHLEVIASEDAAGLRTAYASYGDSWKRRGGVGAFMMMARKWDRLENRVRKGAKPIGELFARLLGDLREMHLDAELEPRDVCEAMLERVRQELDEPRAADAYDIFAHVMADQRAEGVIDDIRDLRRYLMLVEAELRARGFRAVHRDNKRGA